MTQYKLNQLKYQEFIDKQQVLLLYSHIPGTNFFNLPIAAILIWLVAQELGLLTALPAALVLLLVLLLRYGLFLLYQHRSQQFSNTQWQRLYLWGCAAPLALTWGVSVMLFYPSVSDYVQITLLFTIIMLGMIGIPVLAIKLSVYIVYLILASVPIFMQVLLSGEDAQRFLVVVAAIFIFSSVVVGRRFNRTLIDSLRYRAEAEYFSDGLRTANARLSLANEDLERLSVTDDLTGIANRRYFNKRFAEIWADHAREGKILSALMIDVDRFKAYNDTYGHLQGDQCLQQIADAMHSAIYRPRDFIARYGGEEFIILLPDTEREGAEKIAARLHGCIKELNIEHKPQGLHHRLTVSVGACSIGPKSEVSKNIFLQRLDEALYAAKNAGRNTTRFLPVLSEA